MKQTVILLGIALITLSSFSSTKTFELTIYFNELSTNDGKLMVLVQNEDEKDVSKLVLNIANKSAKVSIYLPEGKYGVIAFHDINNNEELDKNMLGIPTEPYGFSNNARGLLSKPNYEETLVNLNQNKSITFDLE
jgi:uncharacterized protein (DUF2141 family)